MMAKLECFEAGLAKITGRFQEVDLYRVRAELEHAIEQNASKALTVDLEGLESVSSAILSMLLCGVRVAERTQCDLTYISMPQKLHDMARVGGLESVLPIRAA